MCRPTVLQSVAQNRHSGNTTLVATGTSVVERTIGLPGRVVRTTRASGDVWSYPNIAGSVTATENALQYVTGRAQNPR
ncbi:unannotated protein [freshwater metagenome]|uniref:Unannotated protein n=1 Tax=freshwater metagenome TaxID=449393 RepID=A0A6J7MD03_9ZZZZ